MAVRKQGTEKKKNRQVTRWKWLTIGSLVMAVGFCIASILASMADNALGVFVEGESWKLVNEDKDAVYYLSDYANTEEMLEDGKTISQQVEAEGAVLLKNESETLPLEKGSRISCFSTSSVNLVYGGTGAGAVDTSSADSLKIALEKEGFTVNPVLWDFYETGEASDYRRKESGYIPVESELFEAPWELYSEEVKASFEEYSDAAVVVFSRMGGEHYDLEYKKINYLALDEVERELLEQVCQLKEEGILNRVIVLLNSSNAMEMDFLKDYPIDACLQIGSVGQYGINAVAEILAGEVNPSGSLVDTWCYSNFTAPAMWNFEPVLYPDAKKEGVPANADSYIVYQEGIYVGYRYYETRYEDYVMGTGNAGDYDYESMVAYPFGYGLSYTEFSYEDMKVSYIESKDQFEIQVTVYNQGERAGKETVQIYLQSPYTEYDKQTGVEKSSVVLCGYAKTGLLNPGEKETLTITVDKKEAASYDTYGHETYILEAGTYYLTAATDAHSAVNQILAAKGYTVQNTDGRMTKDGNKDLTWCWTEEKLDAITYTETKNGTVVKNQLSDADPNLYKGIEETVTWLSRSDWMGTFPEESVKLTLTEILVQDLQHNQYQAQEDAKDITMPVLNAENNITLYDMMGKDMEDPDWELLLDQLSYDDMVALIGDAFHSRSGVESVGAPGARDENGSSGLNTGFLAYEAVATAFPTEDVMAATFNNDLIYEAGRVIGNNCLEADVSCLYGPGANLHRTSYGGRNFEYYSEDPYLSGKMCAAQASGIESMGVDTILKHFALNESEADRIGLGIWVNEQTARELYLKAFQYAFEDAGVNGVMAAYTRWGATWSGGFQNLITGVLREEWGCNGWLISDNVRTTMITAADGLIAGLTTFDAPLPVILNFEQYREDAYIVNLMRKACHYNLYALVNSSAMNGVGADTTVEVVEYFMIPLFRWLAIGFALLACGTGYQWRKKFFYFDKLGYTSSAHALLQSCHRKNKREKIQEIERRYKHDCNYV